MFGQLHYFWTPGKAETSEEGHGGRKLLILWRAGDREREREKERIRERLRKR
jgi:hypothetical protein